MVRGDSPPVAAPHQIVQGHPEVVRQLPGVFQAGQMLSQLKKLIMPLTQSNSLSNLLLRFVAFRA